MTVRDLEIKDITENTRITIRQMCSGTRIKLTHEEVAEVCGVTILQLVIILCKRLNSDDIPRKTKQAIHILCKDSYINLTQEEIAEVCGVTYSQLKRILRYEIE